MLGPLNFTGSLVIKSTSTWPSWTERFLGQGHCDWCKNLTLSTKCISTVVGPSNFIDWLTMRNIWPVVTWGSGLKIQVTVTLQCKTLTLLTKCKPEVLRPLNFTVVLFICIPINSLAPCADYSHLCKQPEPRTEGK